MTCRGDPLNLSADSLRISATRPVVDPLSGSSFVPSIIGVVTAPGTANNTTNAETNLLAGATLVPAATTLTLLAGFPLAADTLQAGRVLRLKLYGTYTTNGSTATITPAVYYNTAAASVKIATGVASGTFASAAGPLGFSYDVLMYMIDDANIVSSGSVVLNGANPAGGASNSPSLYSAAAGVMIDTTVAGNVSASWTGSDPAAGNTFRLLAGSLEILA